MVRQMVWVLGAFVGLGMLLTAVGLTSSVSAGAIEAAPEISAAGIAPELALSVDGEYHNERSPQHDLQTRVCSPGRWESYTVVTTVTIIGTDGQEHVVQVSQTVSVYIPGGCYWLPVAHSHD